MVRPVPDRSFEDDALIVAFALAPGFDAVVADGPLLAALDAPFTAC